DDGELAKPEESAGLAHERRACWSTAHDGDVFDVGCDLEPEQRALGQTVDPAAVSPVRGVGHSPNSDQVLRNHVVTRDVRDVSPDLEPGAAGQPRSERDRQRAWSGSHRESVNLLNIIGDNT